MKKLIIILALSLFSLLIIKGCGSSSSSNSATDEFVLPLSLLDIDVAVTAGSSQNTVDVPPPPRSNYTEFTINAAETLGSVNFSTPSPRSAKLALIDDPVQLSIKVGANEATVCTDGFEFGTFNMTLDEGLNAVGVSPATKDADPATVNVVNKGSFYLCLELQTPVDLEFTVPSVTMSQETCEEGFQDVAGEWTGSYFCENTGCESGGDEITLFINQDEYAASYDDGEAHYDGTVCGNSFVFNGGVEEGFEPYTEEGTFTLIDSMNATKVSTFQVIGSSCRGTCTDTLTRVTGEL